jgi:hypothetical protein
MKPRAFTALASGTLFPPWVGGAPRDLATIWPGSWEQGRPAPEGIAPSGRGTAVQGSAYELT